MKKKILIITPNLKLGGGTANIVSKLSMYLSEKYQMYLLTLQDFHKTETYDFKGIYNSLKEESSLIQKILTDLRISLLIRSFRIYKLIKSILPDIIISFGDDFTNIFTIITKSLFKIKIPLIISIRNNQKLEKKRKSKLINFIGKVFYRLMSVDKIITVSKRLKEILEKQDGIQKEKLLTIYNGIDLNVIEEKKKGNLLRYKEIFYNKNIIKFINLGRLTEQKGHIYLIKAFSRVKNIVKKSKLFIIGEGPLKSKLEYLISKLGLEGDIILLGLIKNPIKYLMMSDIFVLSSLYEGFPNVLLEALACKIPIISSDCETGPREILLNEKFGILVKPMDIEDLAEKMIKLAENKNLLESFSNKSLERAKDFKIEFFFDKWINLIEFYLN